MTKELTVLKNFGSALTSTKLLSFKEVNEFAMQIGYIVTPGACTEPTMQFLKSKKIDVNSTFYKSWNDVTSKTREEIWIDQIINYIGVYGRLGFNYRYTPNDGNHSDLVIDFTNFKVIDVITQSDVDVKCQSMLYSGIALSQETIDDLLSIVENFDIDKVKNKEAMCIIAKATNKLPTSNDEFVRYLVYLATGKTLLIKDKLTIKTIKDSDVNISGLISEFGIIKLSQSFNRYKNLFLAFKTNKQNVNVINQLNRLSKINHIPFVGGYFENILSNSKLLPELEERLLNCTNFKKITLLQTINIRMKECNMSFYGIRNGKLWANDKVKNHNLSYYKVVYDMIYKSLISDLSEKRIINDVETVICLNDGVKLTLPTSEKSFIGNYPLGTSFDISGTDTIVGIHRHAKDAKGFLDFSLNTSDGDKIGWNKLFYNRDCSIVFSGDICDNTCQSEVTELFYCKDAFKGSYILKVNNFDRKETIPFQFFMATEKIENMTKNYMVNPNNIKFMIDLETIGKEDSIGVINNDKLILAQFRTGNKIVSGDSITNKYTEYALNTLDCYLDLETVFKDAGYKFVNKAEKNTKIINVIDLNNLDKSTLISMIS